MNEVIINEENIVKNVDNIVEEDVVIENADNTIEKNNISEGNISEIHSNTANISENISQSEQNYRPKPKTEIGITEEDFRWYCVKTYSAYEERVKKLIESEVKRLGLEYCIREVVIPMETVFEVRNGKKRTKQRNFLAGYVLVNAAISEQKKTKKKIIDLVTETTGVVSFVGRRNDPAALQPAELERIFSRINERSEVATMDKTYRKGDPIVVLVGPFAGFKGTVLEIVSEKQKMKIEITILGRKTPIELGLEQVQFDKPE